MSKIKVAVLQMVSTHDVTNNLNTVKDLLFLAKEEDVNLAVLPEYWCMMGLNDHDKVKIAEEYQDGIIQNYIAKLAKKLGIFIVAGTIPLTSKINDKIYNSLLVFDDNGKCIYRYDKLHLFSYTGSNESYDESKTIVSGNNYPNILLINDFSIKFGICYDLRFPEFFRQDNYDVLILPAAFTYSTGKHHWEILLRARAIENQCYLLASAQGGEHTNKRITYGHSMIIDPWGKIVTQIETGKGFITAVLDKELINNVREKLPALKNRIIGVN